MRASGTSSILSLGCSGRHTLNRMKGGMDRPGGDNVSVAGMKQMSRLVSGIVIVDLSGRITLGEGGVVLRDTVRDLVAQGHKKILLNLANVTYIDSAGIGDLITAYTSVRNRGGDLRLLNLTRRMHDLMQITKLSTIFDIQDDEAAAVESFAAAAASQTA